MLSTYSRFRLKSMTDYERQSVAFQDISDRSAVVLGNFRLSDQNRENSGHVRTNTESDPA